MNSATASAAQVRALAVALALGAGLLLTPAAYGQAVAHPPERMTYQGFLVDGNGAPLGNSAPKNYDVIFRIYAEETGGAAVWSEQQTITVDRGNFSVLLGEGTQVGSDVRPVLSTLFKGASASDRYVAITVKGIGAGGANVDILPRMRLLSSPYAFLAEQATKLVREDNSADLMTSSGNVLNLNGHLDILGSNSIEFGAGIAPKEVNNGRIGYQLYSSGLDVVGAGTNLATRKITFHAQGGSTFLGPVSANSFDGAHFGDGSGLSGVAKLGANTFTGYQEVQNHLRIGELASSGNAAGWGEALIFSGAPPITAGNADNSDPLWLARYNTAANASELRMVIGDDPGSGADAFVIGTMQGSGNFSQTATWSPFAAFTARGLLDFGYGRTKEVSAGTIGYQVHSSDSLDIVGAGTTGSNRKVQMWAEGGLQLNGTLSVSTPSHGLTAQIPSYFLRIYHPTNKGMVFDLDRVDNGVRIWATGGGLGNAGGATTRQIVWDGDGNWDVSSDRKLKKDIEDAEPVLDRALQVRTRRYRWKDGPDDAKKMFGVIAQEVQPLFPDLVGETSDKESGEKHLTVGYSDFGLIAVKALQELKTQQDTEIKDLKSQIADLKAQMKQVLQAAAELQSAASDKSKTTAAVTK